MSAPDGFTRGVNRVASFRLESGETLTDVRQAWTLAGALNERRDNLVVLFHSLTGGPETLAGWAPDVIGPGKAVDTRRWAVLCANLVGSCLGTTFRGSPAPAITTRDMARLVALLVEELGVSSVALASGGSLGGMVALEWAATFPELTRTVAIFAAPAAHTAWGIGWNHLQRRAIEALGAEGLALARMAGMLTYRTPGGLEERFGRSPGSDEAYAVRTWLTRHGEKLVARFDSKSYLALLDVMDGHDVARGRGGVCEALSPFRGRLVGVGIPGDLLYTPEDVRRWTEAVDAEYREVPSRHGHDGFLLETTTVGALLSGLLGEESRASAPRPLARACG